MKAGWEVKRLRDVCEYDKTQFKGGSLAYVGLEDIQSNTGKLVGLPETKNMKSTTFYFTSQHILYGRLRPYLNKVLLPDFEGHCSTEIFPIKPFNKIINRAFLFHWLIADNTMKKINATWTGATLPRANMNEVLDFKIKLPSLKEQQRLVIILDEVFAKISKAKDNSEQNLKNAKELLESYLQSVFEDNDWERKTLDDVCRKITDGSHNPPKGIEYSEYFMLSSKNVFNDSINFEAPRYLKKEDYDSENKRTQVELNDVLLTIVGTIGRVAVVEEKSKYFTLQRSVAVLKPEIKTINSRFLMYSLRYIFDELVDSARGVAQKGLYLNQIRGIEISVPQLNEQEIIVSKIDTLLIETKRLQAIYEQKLKDLEELKKSILQKAFNGEL